MADIAELFERNKAWARSFDEENPGFFEESSKAQSPGYLWIGCADSRVPPNQIVDLPPGEIFVHRNIANVVVPSDLNCLSVIQYAVDVLKVKYILVVGHYGCGGVAASLSSEPHGLIDNWLRHIRNVHRLHANALEDISDSDKKTNRLVELNVIEQMRNVCETTIVRDAWARGQDLRVEGLVYALKDGHLKRLGSRGPQEDDVVVTVS